MSIIPRKQSVVAQTIYSPCPFPSTSAIFVGLPSSIKSLWSQFMLLWKIIEGKISICTCVCMLVLCMCVYTFVHTWVACVHACVCVCTMFAWVCICVHTHMYCSCDCVCLCASKLGPRQNFSLPRVWAHFAAGSFPVGRLRQQAQLEFHEASSCLKAGHRAKSGVFQRLIKALTNANLHHFNDY